jgi:hypothetical protein
MAVYRHERASRFRPTCTLPTASEVVGYVTPSGLLQGICFLPSTCGNIDGFTLCQRIDRGLGCYPNQFCTFWMHDRLTGSNRQLSPTAQFPSYPFPFLQLLIHAAAIAQLSRSAAWRENLQWE